MSVRYMGISGNVPIFSDNLALGIQPQEKTMHPNLIPELNAVIAKCEEDGGVWLDQLEVGTRLYVQTKHTLYEIEKRADGFYISGNAHYCPKPTKAFITGSTFGGSVLKAGFVGVGMYLEFMLKVDGRELGRDGHGRIQTSRILSVSELT